MNGNVFLLLGVLFFIAFAIKGIFSLRAMKTGKIRPLSISKDDAQSAALELVWPLPCCNDSFWGGSADTARITLERIEGRRKAFENYEPAWMRAEINEWFDWARNEAQKNLEDCLTQKTRRDMNDFSKREDEKRKRVRAILGQLKTQKSA